MKNFDIVTVGQVLIDFIPMGKDEFNDTIYLRKAGGAPLNFVGTAAKHGLSTAFIGCVGDDIFGRFLINVMKENNIDVSKMKIDKEHNTTLAFVELDENGDRDFSFYRSKNADIYIYEEDVDVDMVKNCKMFHYGSLSSTHSPAKEAVEYALKIAKENNVLTCYDPNYREPLWDSKEESIAVMKDLMKYADIMKISKEELELVETIEDNVKIAIVTDGANEITYYFKGETRHAYPPQVKAVDTTGAGDIFFGTFVSQFMLSNKAIDDLTIDDVTSFVNEAIRVSSDSVKRKGALASIIL